MKPDTPEKIPAYFSLMSCQVITLKYVTKLYIGRVMVKYCKEYVSLGEQCYIRCIFTIQFSKHYAMVKNHWTEHEGVALYTHVIIKVMVYCGYSLVCAVRSSIVGWIARLYRHLDPLSPQKLIIGNIIKTLSKLDPLWQFFLDPRVYSQQYSFEAFDNDQEVRAVFCDLSKAFWRQAENRLSRC